MTAEYVKNLGTYRITLNRAEAETLASSSTTYSELWTALRTWRDADSFNIYGNKYEVAANLKK